MEYSHNFNVTFHLMTDKEYQGYQHILPDLGIERITLDEESGEVIYPDPEIYHMPDEEADKIFDKEYQEMYQEYIDIGLDEEEADREATDIAENILDDQKQYWFNAHPYAGYAVGYSSDPKLIAASPGEQLTIGDTSIIALGDGKIILEKPVHVNSQYVSREDTNFPFYIDSKIENDLYAIGEEHPELKLTEHELPIPDAVKAEYALTDLDYNHGTAFNEIITGDTGCGKTYKAINDEIEAGRRFAYIAPCRQLVYESYRYYADPDHDRLSTGEVWINSDHAEGNFFGVFESMNPEKLQDFDTLIIDEAHFIQDEERGGELLNLIAACREHDINIKCLTATPNFELHDFKHIHLPSKFIVPEKKEVSVKQAFQNMKSGMQTILFCGSIKDTERFQQNLQDQGITAIAVNSSMLPSERLEAQIAFENKEVQVVCTTNVLAQGLNFKCENMIIYSDYFETPEQQQQKIGRLGRAGLSDRNEVYYAVERHEHKPEKPQHTTRIEKTERSNDHIEAQLANARDIIKSGHTVSYDEIKYCIPQFIEYTKELHHEQTEYYHQKIQTAIKDDLETSQGILSRLKTLTSRPDPDVIQTLNSIKDIDDQNRRKYNYIAVWCKLQTENVLTPEGAQTSNFTSRQGPRSDPEFTQALTEAIDAVNAHIEYLQSEQAYQDYYDNNIPKVDMSQLLAAYDSVQMIVEEQQAIKDIILNNMRTPSLAIAEHILDEPELTPELDKNEHDKDAVLKDDITQDLNTHIMTTISSLNEESIQQFIDEHEEEITGHDQAYAEALFLKTQVGFSITEDGQVLINGELSPVSSQAKDAYDDMLDRFSEEVQPFTAGLTEREHEAENIRDSNMTLKDEHDKGQIR